MTCLSPAHPLAPHLPHPIHGLSLSSKLQTPGSKCQAYIASLGRPPGTPDSSQQGTAQDLPLLSPCPPYHHPSAAPLICSHSPHTPQPPSPSRLAQTHCISLCAAPWHCSPSSLAGIPTRASSLDSLSASRPLPSTLDNPVSTFQANPTALTFHLQPLTAS